VYISHQLQPKGKETSYQATLCMEECIKGLVPEKVGQKWTYLGLNKGLGRFKKKNFRSSSN
jgi:hypothetical protein